MVFAWVQSNSSSLLLFIQINQCWSPESSASDSFQRPIFTVNKATLHNGNAQRANFVFGINGKPVEMSKPILNLRYTIKDLLEHELFQEEIIGMKVELAKPIKEIPKGTQVIPMQLYLDDNKKRDLHKGDEAIAFEFLAGNDDPEEIAKEMVCIKFRSLF